ncbi:uncharacterized protein FPRN_03605 [Fusarium proliferatum]|nr:uncharacterized protein FPRN_03605 [Fusarium proliferatum]
MDLRDVLEAPGSRLVGLPSHQSPSVLSSNPYRPYPAVNTMNHACIYCRQSHMACNLERPCTRCIKRNIGHLCHDEPFDNGSKKTKSVRATQNVQTNTSSLLDSNLRSFHYTISRDHAEGVEDQKYKILSDFGRKHIRAWVSLSLANINSPIADLDTSAKGHESMDSLETHAVPVSKWEQAMMDSMDFPLELLTQLKTVIPPEVTEWGQLKIWLQQKNVPQQIQTDLLNIQYRQFHLPLQRHPSPIQQLQPGQPIQNNTSPGMKAHAAHGGLSNYAAIDSQNHKA